MDTVQQKLIARLEARISPETKALLQKATDLEGRTFKLSDEDSIAFVSTLLNPPQPNDALQAAALHYKRVMSVEVIGDRTFSLVKSDRLSQSNTSISRKSWRFFLR